MHRDLTLRPAHRPLEHMTLGEALSGATAARHGAHAADTLGRASMADMARSHLAPAHNSVPARTGEFGHAAGLAVLAATMTITIGMSVTRPAQGATRPADVSSGIGADSPMTTARSTPLVPLQHEPDLGSRALQRPVLQSRGTLTASLALTEAGRRDELASHAAKVAVADPTSAARIGPGFAKPKSLGRLAEDLPAKRTTATAGVKYAALGKPESSGNRGVSSSRLDGRIATSGHATACLPTALKRVLNQVVANFGPIRINSTSRSHSHNRSVGGAPRSLHLECRAIDFAYHGGRRAKLISFLRNHDAVGGLGNYGHGGHIHIDDGPHRSW